MAIASCKKTRIRLAETGQPRATQESAALLQIAIEELYVLASPNLLVVVDGDVGTLETEIDRPTLSLLRVGVGDARPRENHRREDQVQSVAIGAQ